MNLYPQNRPAFGWSRRNFLGSCCAAVSATSVLAGMAPLRCIGAVADRKKLPDARVRGGAEGGTGVASAPYPLGYGPHLFLDDLLIGKTDRTWSRLQNPVRHPAIPVITREYPWEVGRVQPCGGVIYDAEKNRFRMWYKAHGPTKLPARLAYAESVDGVRWEKPMLNIHRFGSHERTNLVLAPPGGTNEIGVFRDMHEPDPSRRFKAMFDTHRDAVKFTADGRNQRVAFSPDGIHWSPPEGIQVMEGMKDSGISVFWSERFGKYMAYVRGREPRPAAPLPPLGVRGIRHEAYIESSDFLHWSEPVRTLVADEMDGAGGTVQVYQMSIMPYGDVFIGLLCLLHIQSMKPSDVGYLDVQLAVSRDGRNWVRAGNRELFIPRGAPGEWDDQEIRAMQSWVVNDDKIYFYYLGCSHPHATTSPGAVGLATLPADRFLAIEPLFADQPGMLETKPLTSEGRKLLLNASCNQGRLQVEVLDAQGATIAGYEADKCILLPHDGLRSEVGWRTSSGTASLRDIVARSAPFRLRFVLQGDARLFAFQIA